MDSDDEFTPNNDDKKDTVKSECSDSDFDFCEINSTGSTSSFDFCEDSDEIEKKSALESIKSYRSDSSDMECDNDSDDVESIDECLFGTTKRKAFLNNMVVMDPNDYMSNENVALTYIIKQHALPFLSANYLLKLKSVSKDWKNWISCPFLAHKQSYSFRTVSGYFQNSYIGNHSFVPISRQASRITNASLPFLPEKVTIKSSSNGLLLCHGLGIDKNNYYICNPATSSWKKLPQPDLYHGEDPNMVLAFEPSVLNMGAHYQIICVVEDIVLPVFRFEIYSSETNTWKVPDVLCAELGENTSLKTNGYYSNGIVYWETTSDEVVAFDLKNEIHGVLAMPYDAAICGSLVYMKRELCYISARKFSRNVIKVCVFGGMNMVLKMSLQFDLGREFGADRPQVLRFVDEDSMMVLCRSTIYRCYLRDDAKVEIVKMGCGNEEYFPYVNSLVAVA